MCATRPALHASERSGTLAAREVPLRTSPHTLLLAALLPACGPGWLDADDHLALRAQPANRAFTEAELGTPCAYLTGGPEDWEHHNLVMPYRGHMVLPWAAEWGMGGLSFFDVADPCAPTKLSDSYHQFMRETHAVAFLHLDEATDHPGEYAVTNHFSGVMTWDVSDPAAPTVASILEIDDVVYPDSYARVVLAVAWQHPWLYVAAADNGLYVVDTTDPRDLKLVNQVVFEPALRAGGVFALGNKLLVTSAEQREAVLLDTSVPSDPVPFLGGRWTTTTRDGTPSEHYHGNLSGDLAMFARKEGGAGVMIYDVSDPSQPTMVGDVASPGGNGGYVFYDEGHLFLGASTYGEVIDATDLSDMKSVLRMQITGDNDTLVPWGNVAVLSVDDDADDGKPTAIIPWHTDPDSTGPSVLAVHPLDGATGVALTARVGVGFDEIVEPITAFEGSVRLQTEGGRRVPGWVSVQEGQLTYAPKEALSSGTTYVFSVEQGGVQDVHGNATTDVFTCTFTTAGP